MLVLVGTGLRHVDAFIEEVINDLDEVTMVGRPIADRVYIRDLLEKYRPDVLLVGESLAGDEPFLDLFRQLQREHASLRIIFMFQDDDQEHVARFTQQLFQLGIWDTIVPSREGIDRQSIEQALLYPRSRAEAIQLIANLEQSIYGELDRPDRQAMPGARLGSPTIPAKSEEPVEPKPSVPVSPSKPTHADFMTLLSVWSPLGGAGVTTLASNLAVAWAEKTGQRVVLIDGNLRNPHLHLHFGLYDPLRTIVSLYRQVEASAGDDVRLPIEDVLLQHPKQRNLLILTGAPWQPEFQARDEIFYRRLIRAAQHVAPYVIIDCDDAAFEPLTKTALQMSRRILVPLRDLPGTAVSIARALRPGGILSQAQVATSKLELVINGSSKPRAFKDLLEELTGSGEMVRAQIGDYHKPLHQAAYQASPLMLLRPPARFRRDIEQFLP